MSDNFGGAVIEFIFMLTRDDQTLADARDVYRSIASTGVRHVGCKDVGLPREDLQALMADIRANGHTSHLEVVSETEEATLASARAAAEIGPDYLIGGTLIEPVQEIIAGTGIKFFPYVGRIVGHPCLLRGSIAEIAEDARRAEALGVDGINLLAYRYDGDVDALVRGGRRGDGAARDRRRVGRLGGADPGARGARRLGVHDRDRGARRRARPGRAARARSCATPSRRPEMKEGAPRRRPLLDCVPRPLPR